MLEKLREEVRKRMREKRYIHTLGVEEKAVELAEAKDIILIAGKGHETYQILGRKKIHFDDREIARREIVKKKMMIK